MFVSKNTVAACLDYMKERLSPRFSESEIRVIQHLAFEKRLGFSRSDLMLNKTEGLSESDLLFFRDVVKRLLNDEPLQYIIGDTEFFGLRLKVDKRALIPRPETEELVHQIVNKRDGYEGLRILDLCTGSGCIALSLKSAFPTAEVVGVDSEEGALELAKENAVSTGLEVAFHQVDVLKWRESKVLKDAKWDIIVSNPPYIPLQDKQDMCTNVLSFEPHVALFVEDDDPVIFYREIAAYASTSLLSGGLLGFEIHEDLAQETVKQVQEHKFIHVSVLTDLQEKERMVFAENA